MTSCTSVSCLFTLIFLIVLDWLPWTLLGHTLDTPWKKGYFVEGMSEDC